MKSSESSRRVRSRSPSRRREKSRLSSRRRSTSRHRSRSRSRSRSRKYQRKGATDFKSDYASRRHQDSARLEDYFESRRKERELLGLRECPFIWGKSPTREM